MSTVLGIIVLVVVVPYLAGRVRQARSAPWAGPRTAGQRGPAARGRASGASPRQVRAKARADAVLARAKAETQNWLEQQRHGRKNGTPAPVADPAVRTVRIRPPALLRRRAQSAPAAASTDGGGHANGGSAPAPRPASATPQEPGTWWTPATGWGIRSPASAQPAPSGSNGGTPMAGTSIASAEKLIEGINEIHAHAASGGIHAKREAVKAIHEALVRFAAMLAMLSRQMSEPGRNYGPEITEPVAQAGTHAQAGAMSASEADAALTTLINMTVGDLAASPRQAPNHAELSENGSR